MFANLHTLPDGQSMYTLYIGTPPPCVDELDVVASRYADADEVLSASAAIRDELYGDQPVRGIVDQSSGCIILDNRNNH